MTTLTLQPNETDGIDTYINANATGTNYETAVRINVGEDNTNADRFRTLIKFDLSSIPSNAIVTSAILTLTIELDRSSNARNFKMFRVLVDWVESQVNWNNRSTGNAWTTAGAGADGSDADLTTVLATTAFGSADTGTKDFSLDVTEFTKWVNGTYTNYGWLIKADTETNDAYTFHSSSATTAGNRPKLVVIYTVPDDSGIIFFS